MLETNRKELKSKYTDDLDIEKEVVSYYYLAIPVKMVDVTKIVTKNVHKNV